MAIFSLNIVVFILKFLMKKSLIFFLKLQWNFHCISDFSNLMKFTSLHASHAASHWWCDAADDAWWWCRWLLRWLRWCNSKKSKHTMLTSIKTTTIYMHHFFLDVNAFWEAIIWKLLSFLGKKRCSNYDQKLSYHWLPHQKKQAHHVNKR